MLIPMLRAIGLEIRGAKTAIQAIVDALNNGALSGGVDNTIPSKFYLTDDDGKRLLDDSGRVIILGNDPWLGEQTDTPSVTGTRHFIPVDTATTINLLPAATGKYYQLTSLMLSGTAEATWKLKDGNTFKTGYPVGDKGFGVVISLPENLFSTTPGNALVLEVSGGGNVIGHVIAYEYAN